MSDTPQLLQAAGRRFGILVGEVGPEHWTGPTPCSEWNVRALVSHVHTELLWAPPLFEGTTIEEVGNRLDGDLLGEDPVASWDRALGRALDSILEPDAMARSVDLSRGPTPAEIYANELFSDLVIHGWDLAKAIGADDTLDPGWVEILYAEFQPRERAMRSWGVYGPQVTPRDDADLQTKLLALVGRVRTWPEV